MQHRFVSDLTENFSVSKWRIFYDGVHGFNLDIQSMMIRMLGTMEM